MRLSKTLLFAAAIGCLAASPGAWAAAAARTADAPARLIQITALTQADGTLPAQPAEAGRPVYVVFFSPGRAELPAQATEVIGRAVRAASAGRPVSLVIADPAGTADPVADSNLWRLRREAVRRAIRRSLDGNQMVSAS